MNKLTRILRFIVHKMTLLVFALVASLFILTFTVNQITASPESVKNWLSESDTYKNSLQSFLELLNTSSGPNAESAADKLGGNQSISQSKITTAVVEAIDPAFLRDQVEGGIDGLYAWLKGETQTPQFSVSLAGRHSAMIESLTNTLYDELKDRPLCANASNLNTDNLLEANCQIPRAELRVLVVRLIKQDLAKEIAVFSTEGYNGDSLNLSRSSAESIPKNFAIISWVPWFLLLLVIGLSGLIILTAKGLDRGLREAGVALISLAGLTLLGTFILSWVSSLIPVWQPGDKVSTAGEANFAKDVLKPLMEVIINDAMSATRLACLILLLLGGAALAGGLVWKNKVAKRSADAEPIRSPSVK